MLNSFNELQKHFKKRIIFYKSLYKDKRTPNLAKIFLWAALGYFFLPIDLIPDFIPILGHIDDVIIIPLLLWIALQLIPKEIKEDYLE